MSHYFKSSASNFKNQQSKQALKDAKYKAKQAKFNSQNQAKTYTYSPSPPKNKTQAISGYSNEELFFHMKQEIQEAKVQKKYKDSLNSKMTMCKNISPCFTKYDGVITYTIGSGKLGSYGKFEKYAINYYSPMKINLPPINLQPEVATDTSVLSDILNNPDTPDVVKSYYQTQLNEVESQIQKTHQANVEILAQWICHYFHQWKKHGENDSFDGTAAIDNLYNPLILDPLLEKAIRRKCRRYKHNYNVLVSKLHIGSSSAKKFKPYLMVKEPLKLVKMTSISYDYDFYLPSFLPFKCY